MICDACLQQAGSSARQYRIGDRLARLCCTCQGLPFAMVWRMLFRPPVIQEEHGKYGVVS